MKKQRGLLRHLSLIGCIAAFCVLLAPAVSAQVFIPSPYSVGGFQGAEPVIDGTIYGSTGTPVIILPSPFPVSTGTGSPEYPGGIMYPVNPVISLPAIPGQGAGTQVLGAYYTGSITRPAGFSSPGARFMCSF